MDFGIFNLMQQRGAKVTSAELVDDAIRHTRIAESLGFGRAWFAEHHFSNYSLCPSPLMMVAHAAAVTERIRLGTAVIVAPLHMPARLLGEVGLADSLSGGRLDLGIGNGYQHFEFERFRVDIEERRERLFEMLDMIELGLTEKVFEYRGTHYRQAPTAINVRCIQQPHPPIWMASGDHAVNGRAARHGYAPFVSSRFANQEELAPIREHLAESFRREGKGDRPMPLGILSYGCVSESKRDIARYAEAARFQGRIARSLRERREQVESDHSITPVPFANEPSLGFFAVALSKRPGGATGSVAVGAMHLAKGLEFRAVVVAGCDDEVLPLQSRIESVIDEADLEEVYNTERHLLYVACTRARDRLLMTGVDPTSEFLDDLRLAV